MAKIKLKSIEPILSLLHPLVRSWFVKTFENFTPPQVESIPLILKQQNTLISAPTGTGKTLSAFLAILNELVSRSEKKELVDQVYCVYISPLKALGNDVQKNLLEPLNGIKQLAEDQKVSIDVRVGVRSGDTTQNERQKMKVKPPHILITTPESLAILLANETWQNHLKHVEWLVVDEVHALVETKRGADLSLSLERLQHISPKLCRIGLSATAAPLQEIAHYLGGLKSSEKFRPVKIVDVSAIKKLDLQVVGLSSELARLSPKEKQQKLYDLLDDWISSHQTTLIFTNTRAATERMIHHLHEHFPGKYEGLIGAHHSALSKEHRLAVEDGLKEGKYKAVVSSTSLELGIDIGYIDLVVLLSSPKGVAKALQRIGRSGHRLHETVKGRFIAMDPDELVECTVLLHQALKSKIDRLSVIQNPLDVLSQQLVGMSNVSIKVEEARKIVKNSYCFHQLSDKHFDSVVSFLSGKTKSLQGKRFYPKIRIENGEMVIHSKMTKIIYLTNIGTISEQGKIIVKVGNQSVGSVDEAFIEKLKKGDVFVLGGQSYVFAYASGMTAVVKPAEKRKPMVPYWSSDAMPISNDLGQAVGDFRKKFDEQLSLEDEKKFKEWIRSEYHCNEMEEEVLKEYFSAQKLFCGIPSSEELVIESFEIFGQHHSFIHSTFGRRVNEALGQVIAQNLTRLLYLRVDPVVNDLGIMFSHAEFIPIKQAVAALKSSNFESQLSSAMENSEVLVRRFRQCAERSLLLLRNYRGQKKSIGKQQVAARIWYAHLRENDQQFPILLEARREILNDWMDVKRTVSILELIEAKKIKWKFVSTKSPSPFAISLFADAFANYYNYEERNEVVKELYELVNQELKGEYANQKFLVRYR